MCGTDCFLMLLSVLFPPIGVWVKRGICSADSVINIALCVLGFLPGLLHAWYVILQNPDPYDSYESVPDGERGAHGQGGRGDGTVTYYYVAHQAPRHPGGPQRGHGGQQNYGTVGSQPSNGQFPGQQSGTVNAFPAPKNAGGRGGQVGVPAQQGSSSNAPAENPPTYADVIKGDNKVQGP